VLLDKHFLPPLRVSLLDRQHLYPGRELGFGIKSRLILREKFKNDVFFGFKRLVSHAGASSFLGRNTSSIRRAMVGFFDGLTRTAR
jgi:hypothetical protein